MAQRGRGEERTFGTAHPNKKRYQEHRWVMGQWLGRKLQPGETVRHLNGDKLDNRIENLELWASHHPGQRVVDQVQWA